MHVAPLPAGLKAALCAAYNSSQQAAVAASLDRRWPFVLVQVRLSGQTMVVC